MEAEKRIDYIPEYTNEDISVDEFVKWFNDYYGLTARGVEITVDEFYKFPNFDGLSNRETMLQSYLKSTGEYRLHAADESKPDLIKAGVVFAFPQSQVVIETMLIKNKSMFMQQGDFNAYINDMQKILTNDELYYKASTYTLDLARASHAEAQQMNLNLRVWIYSKVLNGIIDISPLVTNCSTSKSKQVGNFKIDINPIKGKAVEEGSLARFQYDVVYNSQKSNEGHVNVFNMWKNTSELNGVFFDDFLQENDIVFIRFEKLACEKDVDLMQDNYLPTTVLGNGSDERSSSGGKYLVWDMIGLIDTINTSFNFSGNDISTSIVGRDLMKLVQDDGNWFYAYKFISGDKSSVLYMGDTSTRSFKRNFVSGEFDMYYFDWGFKRIDDYIAFVMGQLSQFQIVENDVLAGYGDRRTKLSVEKDGAIVDKTMEGIWSIIKYYIDPEIKERTFSGNLGGANGNILQLLNRACQQPFVELYGDTWIDMYNIIVRQPPFTRQAIFSIIDDYHNYITIAGKDLFSTNLMYDNMTYSWYELIPSGSLSSELNESFSALIPVIFFPEIAKFFGNKRLQVEDQYVRINPQKGIDGALNQNNLFAMAINDLMYLIETTLYLPFTRKGTITINGDRRIKVGTFIKLESTNELYYVTQVDNSMTVSYNGVDRVTVLTVERGMKWDFIKGNQQIGNYSWTDASGKMNTRAVMNSYFDLCNTQEMLQYLNGSLVKSEDRAKLRDEVIGNTKINSDVYEYFLKRRYHF